MLIAYGKNFLERRYDKVVYRAAVIIQKAARRYNAKNRVKRQALRKKSQLKKAPSGSAPVAAEELTPKAIVRRSQASAKKQKDMQVVAIDSVSALSGISALSLESIATDSAPSGSGDVPSPAPASRQTSGTSTPRSTSRLGGGATALESTRLVQHPALSSLSDQQFEAEAALVSQELAAQRELRRLRAEREEQSSGFFGGTSTPRLLS